MSLYDLVSRLESNSTLRCLTLDGITTFTRITSRLKRDILQLQPIEESDPGTPPHFLPENVQMFLAGCMGIPLSDIDYLWKASRSYIWDIPLMPLMDEDFSVFKVIGWKYGLSCVNSSTRRSVLIVE